MVVLEWAFLDTLRFYWLAAVLAKFGAPVSHLVASLCLPAAMHSAHQRAICLGCVLNLDSPHSDQPAGSFPFFDKALREQPSHDM
jgi:hypothetical protein